MWMCHLVRFICISVNYDSYSHAYSCSDLPSVYTLTSYDLHLFNYSFGMCYMIYICFSCLAQSNDAALGITGEDLDATALEINKEEEAPQNVAIWTFDDFFQTSHL